MKGSAPSPGLNASDRRIRTRHRVSDEISNCDEPICPSWKAAGFVHRFAGLTAEISATNLSRNVAGCPNADPPSGGLAHTLDQPPLGHQPAQEPKLNGRLESRASTEINKVFQETYFELRRIAHSRLYRNERLTLLDTTSLVHECYLRLSNAELPKFGSPSEMLGYSARVMRSVVVDFIRRRHAQCRGGDLEHTSLDGLDIVAILPCEEEILEVDEAVQVLAQAEPRLAQVVEMKYFGGFNEIEIAESLGVTERTVRRDWEKARELLRVALGR